MGISHHIVVNDVSKDLSVLSNSRPEHVIFSQRNRIKEIIDQNNLAKLFELDFSENYGKSKSLSQENRKFIYHGGGNSNTK